MITRLKKLFGIPSDSRLRTTFFLSPGFQNFFGKELSSARESAISDFKGDTLRQIMLKREERAQAETVDNIIQSGIQQVNAERESESKLKFQKSYS